MRHLIVTALAVAACSRGSEEPTKSTPLRFPGFSLVLPTSVVDKRSEDTYDKGLATLDKQGDQVGMVTWSLASLTTDAEKIARDKLIMKTGDPKPARVELLPEGMKGLALKATANDSDVYLAVFECDGRLVGVQLVETPTVDAKAALRSLTCTGRAQ